MVGREFLCWGTVEGVGLLDLAAAAASGGFDAISITPAMYFAARAEGHSDRDLRARLETLGVSIAMIDPLIRDLPGIPPLDKVGRRFRSTFEHGEDDCYQVAEALGVPTLNLAHFLGAAIEVTTLTDAVGAISARAEARGIGVLVEFMPEGGIPDLATAATISTGAGANCGVMLDTWHLWRCGESADAITSLPTDTVRAVQLSDALDDVFGSGAAPPTRDRLLPGDGLIPLRDILTAVVANHADASFGVEVLNAELTALPASERTARAKISLDRIYGT